MTINNSIIYSCENNLSYIKIEHKEWESDWGGIITEYSFCTCEPDINRLRFLTQADDFNKKMRKIANRQQKGIEVNCQ